jgi:hypothetical protein
MVKPLGILSILLLVAGCASVPFGWSFERAGCVERGLFEALAVPDATDLGWTDIRVGKLPDTGQGPGRAVQFSMHRGGMAPADENSLAVAVGDWQRTCVSILPMSQCPEAAQAYEMLAEITLQVGYKFEQPEGITVLHGTQYFLTAKDGEGNRLDWSYYGPGHDAQRTIDSALHMLEHCAQSTRAEFLADGI